MSGKGKGARGRGRGKALGTPQEPRVMRKRKENETSTGHVEGQAPGEKTRADKQQEPGPSREGKRKRPGTVPVIPVIPQDPESYEIESGDESDSDWQGTSKWQHHVPQSLETPDFVLLSVPPSFKRLMWGGGYVDLGAFMPNVVNDENKVKLTIEEGAIYRKEATKKGKTIDDWTMCFLTLSLP